MLPPALRGELEAVVGAGATTSDSVVAVGGVRPALAVTPGSEEQLSQVARLASDAGVGVCPMGGGTKLEWGNRPRTDYVLLRLHELRGITELDPENLTVAARAGTPVAEVLGAAAAAGTLAPLDPEAPQRATVGGMVATNDQGTRRLGYGGLRDLVLGMHVVLADGSRTKCGGRTMKNVTGYDLTKAFVGSHGILGVISEVTIRLLPRPASTGVALLRVGSLELAAGMCAEVLRSSLAPVALEALSPTSAELVDAGGGRLPSIWADPGADGTSLVLLAGFEGHPAAVSRSIDDVISIHRRVGTGLDAARAAGPGADVVTDPSLVESLYRALGECRTRARDVGLALVAKATVPLGSVWSLAGAATREAETAGIRVAFRVGGGSGAVTFYADPSDVQRCTGLLLRLRSLASASGGHLVVLQGALGLGGDIDVWGEPGDSLPVMQALKARFDPRGILNPGRFVGGI